MEQYELERRNQNEITKSQIGEKVVFKQESPKRDNPSSKSNSKTENLEPNILNKHDSAASLGSTPSSSSSLDGDWEKIGDTDK